MPSPRMAADPPDVVFVAPAGRGGDSGSGMFVCPANFAPMKGMTKRSACAYAVIGISHAITAISEISLGAPAEAQRAKARDASMPPWPGLSNEQAEERASEQRRVDVAVLQRERRAQTIAVGEENQRKVLVWDFDDQRRVRARRQAKLPIQELPVLVLDAPAEAVGHDGV